MPFVSHWTGARPIWEGERQRRFLLRITTASQETSQPRQFSSHCVGQEKLKMKKQYNRTEHFHFSNRLLSILALLFLFSCFSTGASAQRSMAGTRTTVRVTDPQGAVVVKAAVTLYTRDKRVRIKALTDEKGTYVFEDLVPGEYLIEAEATDFA